MCRADQQETPQRVRPDEDGSYTWCGGSNRSASAAAKEGCSAKNGACTGKDGACTVQDCAEKDCWRKKGRQCGPAEEKLKIILDVIVVYFSRTSLVLSDCTVLYSTYTLCTLQDTCTSEKGPPYKAYKKRTCGVQLAYGRTLPIAYDAYK